MFKMAKPATKPLKVTAELLDGKFGSSTSIIMFDGILYHAWFGKYHPEVFETGKWMEYGSGYVGLPLRQLPHNRWATSAGVYEQTNVTVDLNHNYRIPNIIRTVKDSVVEFYCMGHMDKIYELLNYVDWIGKYTPACHGTVKNWRIEEIEMDYSYIHPKYGLMRPTPVDDVVGTELEGYPIKDFAIKPPYHQIKNIRKCYMPNFLE